MDRPSFLFVPGGGIGDLVVSLPVFDVLIQYISPVCDIDVCINHPPDIYKAIIGERVGHVRNFYQDNIPEGVPVYDGSLSANEICNVQIGSSLVDRIPEFIKILDVGALRMAKLGLPAPYLPHLNNQLANFAVKLNLNRATMPLWSLGMDEYPKPVIPIPGPSNDVCGSFVLTGNFITINDGWTARHSGRGTKAWNPYKWSSFVQMCKDQEIQVCQIGSLANGKSYDVDVQLRGKTNFKDVLAILSQSSCHVDVEGGLVHAATALGTKCVVLHGPTNSEFFGYPENTNLTSGSCQNCWWLTPGWMDHCLREKHTCMNHRPEDVFGAVENILFKC